MDSAATLLKHFPPEVGAAYRSFQTTGDAAAAAVVVRAVVRDHLPDRSGASQVVFTGAESLLGDLHFDSLALSEMVFFFEDLFGVTIANEEIGGVRTVDDLTAFVIAKHAARAASAP